MNATVTLALSELDILRDEPRKVREQVNVEKESLLNKILEQNKINSQLVLERDEAVKKSKGITITVKEKTEQPAHIMWNGWGNYSSYIPEPITKEISSVTYSNMDEILETIKDTLDKEQKQQLKSALDKINEHENKVKEIRESHLKEIRILKDELNDSDTKEKLAKLQREFNKLKNRSLIDRILNK